MIERVKQGADVVDGGGGSSMRLNFSYSTNEQLETGMKRLGTVIERKMKVLCR